MDDVAERLVPGNSRAGAWSKKCAGFAAAAETRGKFGRFWEIKSGVMLSSDAVNVLVSSTENPQFRAFLLVLEEGSLLQDAFSGSMAAGLAFDATPPASFLRPPRQHTQYKTAKKMTTNAAEKTVARLIVETDEFDDALDGSDGTALEEALVFKEALFVALKEALRDELALKELLYENAEISTMAIKPDPLTAIPFI